MERWGLIAIGWVCVVVGAIMTPLPWPFGFGAPLLFIGLYILATRSKWTRRGLQRLRNRYPVISTRLEGWKESSIPQVRRFVKITAPQAFKRRSRILAWRKRRLRAGRGSSDNAEGA